MEKCVASTGAKAHKPTQQSLQIKWGMQCRNATPTQPTQQPTHNKIQQTKLICNHPNGKMYGMTIFGGINNNGVLFEYDPATNVNTLFNVI